MIEEVEGISAKLEPEPLADLHIFGEREIDIEQARTAHLAVAGASRTDSGARYRADRHKRERRSIEKLQCSPAVRQDRVSTYVVRPRYLEGRALRDQQRLARRGGKNTGGFPAAQRVPEEGPAAGQARQLVHYVESEIVRYV